MSSSTAKKAAAKPGKLPVDIRQTKLLIDGKWVSAQSGKTFETLNPSTGQVIARVAEAGKADVDKAVKAARKAFEKGPWGKMNARERGKLMFKFADLIEKNLPELAALESLDPVLRAAVALAHQS